MVDVIIFIAHELTSDLANGATHSMISESGTSKLNGSLAERTVEMIMTGFSLPWNDSAVPTSTFPNLSACSA